MRDQESLFWGFSVRCTLTTHNVYLVRLVTSINGPLSSRKVEVKSKIHSSRAISESSPMYAKQEIKNHSLDPSACAKKKQFVTLGELGKCRYVWATAAHKERARPTGCSGPSISSTPSSH
jgi:hypothetical protein